MIPRSNRTKCKARIYPSIHSVMCLILMAFCTLMRFIKSTSYSLAIRALRLISTPILFSGEGFFASHSSLNCNSNKVKKSSPVIASIVIRINILLLLVSSSQSISFNYTGTQQQLSIPSSVNSVHIIMCGAAGGTYNGQLPGYGAKVQATISVTPSSTLYIYVGGQPIVSGDDASAAGYNGGGMGSYPGSGGGGSSDIRTTSDITTRIAVAGGGGGYSGTCTAQGGSAGQNGLIGCDGDSTSGAGATQIAGNSGGVGAGGNGADGTLGVGGSANQDGSSSAGGGGGGYFGGGGGGYSISPAVSGGGGGGSSYATDTNAVFTSGYCTGNGFVVITLIKSPTSQPSSQPSRMPSRQPSMQPSTHPTQQPTRRPTMQPSTRPTSHPTMQPTRVPTNQPTGQPSRRPTSQPSRQPSRQPTSQPTRVPFSRPTSQPSRQPTSQPTRLPTCQPTIQPTRVPTMQPTRQPTRQPTSQPTLQPVMRPSAMPTSHPSRQPTRVPSCQPTMQPSRRPTSQPSRQPSRQPTSQPTLQPVMRPTGTPSRQPTMQPSRQPTVQPTSQPTRMPTTQPTSQPICRPTSQPSRQPFSRPSGQPSCQPSSQPSRAPSTQPSSRPTEQPSTQPTRQPSSQPTMQPTRQPFSRPSGQPSRRPTAQPSRVPTVQPTMQPSRVPSMQPTRQPTSQPTMQPSRQPFSRPTGQPSNRPSGQPSRAPTSQPSSRPSRQPTVQPTRQPTRRPSAQPTRIPTSQPTRQPSVQPTSQPSRRPTVQPTSQPSRTPSMQPTTQPSRRPSMQPSRMPTQQPTRQPSVQPSSQPTRVPTVQPTTQPSRKPSQQPTSQPSRQPTTQPTRVPTRQPTRQPSVQPSSQPTRNPTTQPTAQPSRHPTSQPSCRPSQQPSAQPSECPTMQPSGQPSGHPTMQPSVQPTRQPTAQPTSHPSMQPTEKPSTQPTSQPSRQPSSRPSTQPSGRPSNQPTSHPSMQPSCQPSGHPSMQPTSRPSMQPSRKPTTQPSMQPSSQPTMLPTGQPSGHPSQQPSAQPSSKPSQQPSGCPSVQPSGCPSMQPSRQPSSQPSMQPSAQPSGRPSMQPTRRPSMQPSRQPSGHPSCQPTRIPTNQPSSNPTNPSAQPTGQPSRRPTMQPSRQPTRRPTSQPSRNPTRQPTAQPSRHPTAQPSRCPTTQPTGQPSRHPTSQPSRQPTTQPTGQPSRHPTSQPSRQPVMVPTGQPSTQPTVSPTGVPTDQPSMQPTGIPSRQPSMQPTRQPTSQPSMQPTCRPSAQPTRQPTSQPSRQPTRQPTSQPTRVPTTQPSAAPTRQPSSQPSRQPTNRPSQQPTRQPTSQPSRQPSAQPSVQPSMIPSAQPSGVPSVQPSGVPSMQPSGRPTEQPSQQPTSQPTRLPSMQPSSQPSRVPSTQPSSRPTIQPSSQPSKQPFNRPTAQPSRRPTSQPSRQPSMQPTSQPSRRPTSQPSRQPTRQPTSQPSRIPTCQPSAAPSVQPTRQPTARPSEQPSGSPSGQPTDMPSRQPSVQPSSAPSEQPSSQPTRQPTTQPTSQPTRQPTSQPSMIPSIQPTGQPTRQPYSRPTGQPSRQPTMQPSGQPSRVPTMQPTRQPSTQPSASPTRQPTMQPSRQPTSRPSGQPSRIPSSQPTRQPTRLPTAQPTRQPSTQPTKVPTIQPSGQPSGQPTRIPTAQPTRNPSSQPSVQPTVQPSSVPTRQPSSQPSKSPSRQPTAQPSRQPTQQPSARPTRQPSAQPSRVPTRQPTGQPSRRPTSQPSSRPSRQPTSQPSSRPTRQPSSQPTRQPTRQPSSHPTRQPSGQPSRQPTRQPTGQPSRSPTQQPSSHPSCQPTDRPTGDPSMQPTSSPSGQPSAQPSGEPSGQPSIAPSMQPSSQPTSRPSSTPSAQPSRRPTSQPSAFPSRQPSKQPSSHPTGQPSQQPFMSPSTHPSSQPSALPSHQPSNQPTSQPSVPISGRYVPIVGMRNVPLVGSLSSSLAKYSLMIEVSLYKKEDTTVYCAAYPSASTYSEPLTTDEIVAQDFRTLASDSLPAVIITGLSPATQYNIFCMTVSLTGSQMPYYEMITHELVTTTLCCKVVNIGILQPSLYASNYYSAFSLQVMTAPTSQITITLSFVANSSGVALGSSGFLSPSTISVTSSSPVTTVYNPVLSLGSVASGFYKLSASLSGDSAGEYEVDYTPQNLVQVLSTTSDPAVPSVSLARFSADGVSVTITFSAPTNQNNVKNVFLCSSLLWFKSMATSTCVWTDTTHINIYFSSSVSTNALLSVGDNITIKGGMIRAACVSSNATRCSFFSPMATQNVTILPPVSPTVPNVVISGPTVLGVCNSMPLDLTFSTGNAGRQWSSIFYRVLDNVDRYAYSIEKFLSVNYTLQAPHNVIPAELFVRGRHYTFQVTMCNFLTACGSGSLNVYVTNATDASVPIVSIVSSTYVTTLSSLPLSIVGTAYNQLCSGQKVYSGLTYSWSSVALVVPSGTNATVLSSSSSNPLIFKVPSYGLVPKVQYKITLTATSTATAESSSASAIVTVANSDVVARIVGSGATRYLHRGGFLLIDASSSFDGNYPAGSNKATLFFSWTCGQLMPTYNSSSCGLLLKGSQSSVLNITAPSSASGSFRLTATVRVSGGRFSTAFSDVTIVDVPQNTLSISVSTAISTTSSSYLVNTNVRNTLVASVEVVSSCLAVWSVDDSSVDLQSAALVPINATLQLGSNSYFLLLNANTLSQRSTYLFSLQCLNSTSSAVVTIVTNGAPLPGVFAATPSVGVTLQTVFLFSATYWTDEDLPLSYQVVYVEPGTDGSVNQVVVSKSYVSTGSSVLPSGSFADAYNLTVVLSVFDLYDSSTLMSREVKVNPISTQSQSITALLSTVTYGSLDNSKQVLAAVSSSLNSVNCSFAADCSSLNRNPCSTTSYTCGPCLSGYVGDQGDSNSACSSVDFDDTDIASIVCSVDADCGSAWYVCELSTCSLKSKQCTQSCNGHGSCEYRNSNSDKLVANCRVSDPSCIAVCTCNTGFYGSFCELTINALIEQYDQRSTLAILLHNVTLVDDASESNIASWSSALYSISSNPYQVSGSDAATMIQIADSIITTAASMGLRQYEDILPLLQSIDSLASVSSYFEIPSASSSVTVAVNNTPGGNIVDLVGQFGSLIGTQMVLGQSPTVYVYDNFRMVVQVQSLNDEVNVSSPQTDLELQADTLSSGMVIAPQMSGSHRRLTSTSSGKNLISTALIETKLKTFGTTITEKLNSNAFYLSLNGADGSLDSQDILDGIDHVEFMFANLEYEKRFQTGYEVNFTTVCNGVTDIANYTYVCEDSETVLVHSCTGTVGTFLSYCPVAQPVCDFLSVSGSVSQLFEVTSCTVLSYSELFTVCSCSVDGSHHRRLSGSYHDTTPHTNAAFDSNAATLMGSANTFNPSPFPSTFTELLESPTKNPQIVFGIVFLYSGLMFASLLSIGWKRYTLDSSNKKKVAPSTLSKSQKALLALPASEASIAESGLSYSQKNVLLRRQMSDYIFSLLPSIFANTRNPALGKVPFLQCVWAEFARHHRYLTVWSYSFGSQEQMMSLTRLYTTLSFMISCVVLLMSFQSLADDHQCKHHLDVDSCLSQHTWIDTHDTYCRWEPDPTAPNPSTAAYVCAYKTPGFTPYVLLVIILITAGAVTLFSYVLEHFLRVVFQSAIYPNDRPLWKQLTESRKVQVKPTEDFENPRSPKTKRDENDYVINRFVPSTLEPRRGTINESFSKFKEEHFTSGRLRNEFVSPSRLQVNFSKRSSGIDDDEHDEIDVEENRAAEGTMQLSSLFNYYPILDEVIRERETFDHQENIKKALLDRIANQQKAKEQREQAEAEEAQNRLKLQQALSLISSDDDSSDDDSDDDLFSGAPVSVQRRLAESLVVGSISQAIRKTVHPEGEEEEVAVKAKTSDKVSVPEERIEDVGQTETNPVVNLFEQQWGIERTEFHHFRIREDVRTAIMADVQKSDSKASDLLQNVMKDGSDAHYGMNVVQQLMLDLLERDTGAARILEKKFQRDFPPLILVSSWYRTAVSRFLILLNACFCAFCIYWTIDRSMYWQSTFLAVVGILMVSEMLIFASIECLLTHVVIPNTIRPDWNRCVATLNKLISDLTALPPDESTVVPAKKYLLNAASHLFVSHKLAAQYQLLFESKLVLLYCTELPDRMCRLWHPQGSLFVPSVETLDVVVTPPGRRVLCVGGANRFTRFLVSWIVFFAVRLSSETEEIVLRLTPVAWFGGLAYAWFWFVSQSSLVAYVLVGFALGLFCAYAITACVVYVKCCDDLYHAPTERTRMLTKVGIAPTADNIIPDVVNDAAEPSVDLVEARRASFKVPLIQISSSDDSDKKTDKPDPEGKEETDDFDAEGLVKAFNNEDDLLSTGRGKGARKNKMSFMTGSLTMSDDEDEEGAPKPSAVDSLIQATKQRRETMHTGGALLFSPAKKGPANRASFMAVPHHFKGVKGISDRIRKDAMQFSDGEEEDEDEDLDEDHDEGNDTFEYTPGNKAAPVDDSAAGPSSADALINSFKNRRETMRSSVLNPLPAISPKGAVAAVTALQPISGKKNRMSFMDMPANFKGKQGLPSKIRKDALQLSDDEGDENEEGEEPLAEEPAGEDDGDLFDDDIHGPLSGGKLLGPVPQLNADSVVEEDSMMLDEMSLQMESTIAEDDMSDSSGDDDDHSVGSTRRTMVVKDLIKIFEPDEKGGDGKKHKKKTVRISHIEAPKVKTLPVLSEIRTINEDDDEDERFSESNELRPSSVASNKRPTSVSENRTAQQVSSNVESLLASVKNRRTTMNAAGHSPVRESFVSSSPHGLGSGFDSGSHRLAPLAPINDRRASRLSPGGPVPSLVNQSPGRQSVLINSGRMSFMSGSTGLVGGGGSSGLSGGSASGGLSPGRSSFLASPLPSINAHSLKRPVPALFQQKSGRMMEEDDDDDLEVLEL